MLSALFRHVSAKFPASQISLITQHAKSIHFIRHLTAFCILFDFLHHSFACSTMLLALFRYFSAKFPASQISLITQHAKSIHFTRHLAAFCIFPPTSPLSPPISPIHPLLPINFTKNKRKLLYIFIKMW